MIRGFEEITKPLTEYEKGLIDVVLNGFNKHRGKHMIISGKEIVRKMKEKGYRMNEPRLRKIVNHIRANGMAAVCSNTKGYWLAENTIEIEENIQSLEDRISAMMVAKKGLQLMIAKH